MKKRKPALTIPKPTPAEIQATLLKSQTIQLRVTDAEKTEIVACAKLLKLTQTDYLLGCHAVVAAKILRRD